MSAAFIGLDLAKSVFQVHGVDVHGTEAVRRRQALISSITKRLRRLDRMETKAISMKATRCSVVRSKIVFNRR
jgi:hypothetical protein